MMLSNALFYSFFGGAFMALKVVMYAEFFGLANLPRAFGLGSTSFIFGGFAGSPFAGWIHDTTGSDTAAWLICGGFLRSSPVPARALCSTS